MESSFLAVESEELQQGKKREEYYESNEYFMADYAKNESAYYGWLFQYPTINNLNL